ncbi:hypothetical protein [Campylobacter ureolyticus]|uniref:hypothetical protein n=1 Tax=Campylobacter ureolyticus TaxID=827 RepID=UPI001FC8AFC7|nr:hypothetical protein [Campylobacter ureolyticus]MCZ6104954.1 hypothetical protein [Campylobacter ureolyticus]MCZ6158001.1 hypothetical protein [Campylobacter ureolyticus]MCZ6168091.1 hypothetical protein [Campylobacter ureolyticus]GKH61336.1 hypothetical protein CE91St25_16720 [Campylobacter ureolyticus]
MKINEKNKRVKYLRALDRFVKSAINILKREDFDDEIFRKRVEKNTQTLEKVEPVLLNDPYTKALENFANSVIQNKNKDELLKEANLLDKLKNSKNYKKEKHKKFDEC